ncbi:hypothetical protein NC651_033921 [Populus alba x Populus x berolinensis]|nr:hypothetical protein NC651_033921 [Populus alba x Populus x berolinensis]
MNTKSPSLVFFWPQVVHAWRHAPVRGSRVVFASYRDGLGQANFFPMMHKLVVCVVGLKDIRNVGLPSSKLGSDVSPPSEHISSNGIQDSLYPVLKVCSALSSRQLHLLKLRSCMCDLPQLFCSPIRLLHGGKTSPDAKMAKLPTLPIKHDFQMAHSAATLVPCLPVFPLISQALAPRQNKKPATMPLPCDLSFQIRGCMTGSSFNGEGISLFSNCTLGA